MGQVKAARGEAIAWLRANYETPADGSHVLWPFGRIGPYGKVQLNGRQITAHHAALELRVGPAGPKQEACHSCDVKLCIAHAYWGTRRQNQDDMDAAGRRCLGDRHPGSKLTPATVTEIRGMLASASNQQIGDRFGVSRALISKLRRGVTWKWLR